MSKRSLAEAQMLYWIESPLRCFSENYIVSNDPGAFNLNGNCTLSALRKGNQVRNFQGQLRFNF
mgnify:CR=1 FL=1